MTDARERIAAAIEEVWSPGFCPDGERFDQEVDAILAALNLTPEAASALMDGTAVVVPVETARLIDRAYLPANLAKVRRAHPDVLKALHEFKGILAASPYRSNSDDN